MVANTFDEESTARANGASTEFDVDNVVYGAESTNRAVDVASAPFATTDPADEKDNLDDMRSKLAKKKKPIYAGLAFLVVVVICVSVGVSTGGSSKANTESKNENTPAPEPKTTAPSSVPDDEGLVNPYGSSESSSTSTSASASSFSSASNSSDGSQVWNEDWVGGEYDIGSNASASASESPSTTGSPATTAPSTPEPTTTKPQEPPAEYTDIGFDWTNKDNWEYADGSGIPDGMFGDDGIKLTSSNSKQPIRTHEGWGGERVVLIEWERSSSSDTNIWMLNTKLQSQFGKGNGWPYWGELDIFEMFTQDTIDQPGYSFSGFGGFSDVASYGQLTLHMGPAAENGKPCFCPASFSKNAWYKNIQSMVSGCSAQFSNDEKNSIATVLGRDENGQFLQLIQNPTVTKGGKVNDQDTYDVSQGSGAVTAKIYNNKDQFWGADASSPCASAGGHDPETGFPFFEEFRIILEEQKKDSDAWFKVTNVKVLKK